MHLESTEAIALKIIAGIIYSKVLGERHPYVETENSYSVIKVTTLQLIKVRLVPGFFCNMQDKMEWNGVI